MVVVDGAWGRVAGGSVGGRRAHVSGGTGVERARSADGVKGRHRVPSHEYDDGRRLRVLTVTTATNHTCTEQRRLMPRRHHQNKDYISYICAKKLTGEQINLVCRA